jgi:hypothetical protein
VLRNRAKLVLDSIAGEDEDLTLDQVVIEEDAVELHSDDSEVFADDEKAD